MAAAPESDLKAALDAQGDLMKKYGEAVDRESAFEQLSEVAKQDEEAAKRALLAQQAEELAAQEAAAQAQAQEQIDNVLEIKNEKSMELKQEIRKFTEENPEIAAQMIRTWLRGEGANG